MTFYVIYTPILTTNYGIFEFENNKISLRVVECMCVSANATLIFDLSFTSYATDGGIVLVDASRVALATERANQVQQHLIPSHGLDVGHLSTAETESVAEGAGLRFDLK